MPTNSKEFVCSQEYVNKHNTHTAAVCGVGYEVLGHLPREFSHKNKGYSAKRMAIAGAPSPL